MSIYKDQNQLLDDSILALKIRQQQSLEEVKYQLEVCVDSFKPSKIINNTLHDLKESFEFKNNIFESILSLGGGYLSKKLIEGKSNSMFKRIMGTVIQFGVTRFLSKNVQL